MENKIITSTEIIEKREDGIIMCTVLDGIHLDVEQAKENVKAVHHLANFEPCKVIVDIRPAIGITRDARKYFMTEEVAVVQSACAMIIDSPISTIMGNFFMGINKPKFPTRLFRDIRKAEEWLHSLK